MNELGVPPPLSQGVSYTEQVPYIQVYTFFRSKFLHAIFPALNAVFAYFFHLTLSLYFYRKIIMFSQSKMVFHVVAKSLDIIS